jgi:hypothetical protein
LPNVPVILSSGSHAPAALTEAPESDVWFLAKPFRLRGLSQRIGEALDGPETPART